ncbi:MAG TPA: ROK family protein [Aliidongia sp.]|nr:ROK family protein [Aliidongia sp.]
MLAGDTELVRAINRYQVLHAIRRFEPVCRAEIGRHTGLGRTTISAITASLLGEDVIRYDQGEPRGVSARGRPRELLRMNPNFAYVVGAKLSMHQISVAVTNLRAEPLASVVVPVRNWAVGPDGIANMVEDAIRAAIVKAGTDLTRIAGVGLGVPGFVDSVTGVSQWSPILGEQPVPFTEMMRARLGVMTLIENDANLVTLAERWFGCGQDVENFVVVTVEGGVGMGHFIHGDLYHGHHGMGTEFGHIKIDRHGPPCRCGQNGCVEAFAADYAILREARNLAGLPPVHDEIAIELGMRDVTRRARAGDPALVDLFRRVGETLGLGIANLVNLLDPGRVILTGAGLRAADLIEPALREALAANSLSVLKGRCELVFHTWTDEVWARGSAALVLQGLYREPWRGATRVVSEVV